MNNYNILIVEDEFINAHFIEKVILKLGHDVIATVKTGDEAIDIVEKKSIDIIFMDINLDGNMDGIQCSRIINEIKKIPIIYTTAYSDSKTINEAIGTNLFGYLIKPFYYHDIESVLNITIKQNFLNKEVFKKSDTPLSTQINQSYKYFVKTKTLMKDEEVIKLTKKESDIFYYLFLKLNQIVSFEHLSHYVWEDKVVASSTIRDTILRLRKKIPDLKIQTISGIGYSLLLIPESTVL